MSIQLRMQEMETKKPEGNWYIRRHWEAMRLPTEIVGESKTQQSHKQSVDVNHIIAKFDRTGQLPQARMEAQYGDVSDLNAPYGELIEKSRATLDTAGQFFEENDKKTKAEKAAAEAAEKAELEELRKTKKEAKKPPES